ncbi:MAG: PadR family transcriptional regulator [Lachnotalea sp.]
MIRGLILYYLNNKPTHGYEIQRFIQISGLDQWAKIQSGSIYYALTKLEKEKNIIIQREERTGSRVRKIYEITDAGKQALQEEMRTELATPILEIGSLKYVVYPMLGVLDKKDMESIIKKHIMDLEDKKKYWEVWKNVKAGEDALKLTRLSFVMTIHTLEDQILWHQELLEHLEDYTEEAKSMAHMIQMFEPDSMDERSDDTKFSKQLEQIEIIKQSVELDPKKAIEQLNQIIEEMKNKL